MQQLKKQILPFYLSWIVFSVVSYHLPLPEEFSSFQLSLTLFLFIALSLLLVSTLSHRLIHFVFEEEKKRLFLISGFTLVLFVCIYIYSIYFSPSILISSISTANLLFFATILGAVLSSGVKRVAELVPICCLAAAADLASVLRGPTKEMIGSLTSYYEGGMAGKPPFVDFIIIKIGVPGLDVAMPLFGVTDWIFIILISSAMIRLHKRDNLFRQSSFGSLCLYFPVAAAALLAGLIFAQITGSFVPAMVFISSIFLFFLFVKNKIHKELTRLDITYSIIFPVIVVVVVVVFHEMKIMEL